MQKNLEDKSINQISKEINISKGKVHYAIKEWKDKLVSTDYDEIFTFAKLVNRSNITIEQCTPKF